MVIISIIYVIGIRTWFAVCESTGDMVMSCHWAGEVMKAFSIVFLVTSAVHLCLPDSKIKLGMDITFLYMVAAAVFIPGGMIGLCQSMDMACRKGTQVWTIILCALLLVMIIADIILYASGISREKHHRKADA